MRILFDLSATQSAGKIKNHGGGEYARAVFIKLIEVCPDSVSVILNEDLPLDKNLSELLNTHSINSMQSTDIGLVWDYIVKNRINLFYTALPDERFKLLVEKQSEHFKVIITIHGLRQLEYPFDKYEWFYIQSCRSAIKYFYKKLLSVSYRKTILKHYDWLPGASKIITVSNHSREVILRFFPGLREDKIEVFYSPLTEYTLWGDDPAEILNRFRLSENRYFLVLSGSIWIKNSYRAIRAFDDLITNYPDYCGYKMLITGMGNLTFRVKNSSNFVFLDYLDRNDLESLIRLSHALVYPTLNEGFGYPPLEAFKYGVPVLASEIAAVMEVCGDQAIYFNPLDIMDIRLSMLRSIESDNLHNPENSARRVARYNQIRTRQKQDLDKLVNLLCGSS